MDGVALRHVLAAARDANELTHWRSGVTFFAVAFRPLVPGESTCAEIAG